MKSFLQILKYILPYKTRLLIAVFFAILFSLSNALTIYSIVPIFDTITEKDKFSFTITPEELNTAEKSVKSPFELAKSFRTWLKIQANSFLTGKSKKEILIFISLMIIPLIFLRSVFDFIARYIFSYSGNRAVLNIRKELYNHLIRLPYSFFHKSRSGEILSRITNDVIPLTTAVSNDVYQFCSGSVLLATNVLILTLINWKLIVFIILLSPLIGMPIGFFGNKVKKYTRKIQENIADISSHLNETITGIRIIKSFLTERFETERFEKINKEIFKSSLRRRILQNLNPGIVEFLGSLIAIAMFIFGGYQIINGEISSGEFIFFLLLVLNLFEPIKMISDAINGTKAGEAASKRIIQFFEYPIENFSAGTEGSFNREIKFNNISFMYNDVPVLKDIDINIPRGGTIAIVGPSGSGKSTLLNLIPAFYFPFKNDIFFDNKSTRDLSLNWIRKKIAMVTQEVFLFNGTILENITCGKSYTMEDVINAAKTANAHNFISGLSRGYETQIGERGLLLSGGERQRITIARAIFNDPEIILFDEATSSLDSESEKVIKDALEYLFKTRTSLIVSHRLSTVQNSDIIYYIERGKVIDKGKHADLFERSASYRILFNI